MSEATDQAAARVRTMEGHDAKAIEVIADALGGLGYELNSGLEVAQFMQTLAAREVAGWIGGRGMNGDENNSSHMGGKVHTATPHPSQAGESI